ncbi:MAG: hypothetical protein AAB804_03265 [Patescibacteria group bacterium]
MPEKKDFLVFVETRAGLLLGALAVFSVLFFASPGVVHAAAARPSSVSVQCYTNYTSGSLEGCTPAEIAAADAANGVAPQNDAANSQGQAAQLMNQGANAANTAVPYQPSAAGTADCTPAWRNISAIFSPRCWMRMLGALVTSVFIWIGVMTLEIAGLLFNYLLDFTVIKFSTAIYTNIKDAVEIGWTVFRDLANILIIGIFTFIAIGTILGLENYNAKKMVAKVLIIAVLINFSLLFTKMIIDASNFTASQFYYAALGQVARSSAQGTSVNVAPTGGSMQQASAGTKGISGQFMQAIGITGFGDSYNQIRARQEKSDNGLVGIGFGLLSLIYLLGMAIVFFYGCFLLISRAILLIFLMITSSIAFASYLIPQWETSSYGWKTWKDSLVKSAVFAPLLMLFIWVTLLLAQGLTKITSGSTIGGIVEAPAESIPAAFGYFMILGMIFLSFRLSSSFASKIAGFSMASIAPALGLAAGARVAGLLGRYGLGIPGGMAARRLTALGKDQEGRGNVLTGKGIQRFANRLQSATEKRDFNLMNTSLGKQITATAGLKGKWTGATKFGGIEGVTKKQAEGYAKDAEKMTFTHEEKSKMFEEAAKNVASRPENKEDAQRLKDMHETAKKTLEQSEREAKENKERHKESLKQAKEHHDATERDAQSQIKSIEKSSQDTISRLERDKEYTPEGSTAREEFEKQIVAARADSASKMNAEKNRIETARAEVTRLNKLIETEDPQVVAARKKLSEAEKEKEEFGKKIKEMAETEVRLKYPNLDKTTEEIAGKLANTRATNLFGALQSEANDHLAKLTRDKVKVTKEDKRLKRVLENSLKDGSEEEKPKAEETH